MAARGADSGPGRRGTGQGQGRPGAAAALVGANLVWGASYPATALALRGMSSATLAAVRLGVGALLLLPLLRARGGKRWDAAAWRSAVGLGLCGYTLPVYLQIVGLHRTSPALAAIFVALEPLLTALFAAVALRQALPPRRRLALAVAGLGAWATAGFPRPGAAGHLSGDLLLLLANGGFAAYNALSLRLSERVSAPSATAATLAVGFLGMVPVWLVSGGGLAPHAGSAAWTAAAFLAVPGTAGAYLAWMWAVTRLPVASAALFLYLQPVFGVLLSVALTGARPPLSFYIGSVAILGALFIGQAGAQAAAQAPAALQAAGAVGDAG